MRAVHLRKRFAVGRPLADRDLLLSRTDGMGLPVRDYRREFTAQRETEGTKANSARKAAAFQHLSDARGGIAADMVAAWHRRSWSESQFAPDRDEVRS